LKYQYLRDLQTLRGDPGMPERLNGNSDQLSWFMVMRWFPWERARTERILNMLAAREFSQCRAAEVALAAGGAAPKPPDDRLLPELPQDYLDDVVRGNFHYQPIEYSLRVETYRRATLLILALEAWKLDHGSLPQSLDELKDKYIEQIPVSPFTGGTFNYEPKGLPRDGGSASQAAPASPAFPKGGYGPRGRYGRTIVRPGSSDGGESVQPTKPGRQIISCGSWPASGFEDLHASKEDSAEPFVMGGSFGFVFPIP